MGNIRLGQYIFCEVVKKKRVSSLRKKTSTSCSVIHICLNLFFSSGVLWVIILQL